VSTPSPRPRRARWLALLVPIVFVPGAIPAFLAYVLVRRSGRQPGRLALVAICGAAAGAGLLLVFAASRLFSLDFWIFGPDPLPDAPEAPPL
jgi:hypothetical protein